MSDSAAFHEVDEAVRKDELKEWWGRYGTLVVAAAVSRGRGRGGLGRLAPVRRLAARRGQCRLFGGAGQDPPGPGGRAGRVREAGYERARTLSLAGVHDRRAVARARSRRRSRPWRRGPHCSSPELADLATVMAAFRSVDTPKADEMIAKLEPLAAARPPVPAQRARIAGADASRKGDMKRAGTVDGQIVDRSSR